MTVSQEPSHLTLHQIGLPAQEIKLLHSLCNDKPAMLEPFVFLADSLTAHQCPDVLLVDADQPDALEQLRRSRHLRPRHLVLVTARDKRHRLYPTLKRPLSFSSLQATLSPLASQS